MGLELNDWNNYGARYLNNSRAPVITWRSLAVIYRSVLIDLFAYVIPPTGGSSVLSMTAITEMAKHRRRLCPFQPTRAPCRIISRTRRDERFLFPFDLILTSTRVGVHRGMKMLDRIFTTATRNPSVIRLTVCNLTNDCGGCLRTMIYI